MAFPGSNPATGPEYIPFWAAEDAEGGMGKRRLARGDAETRANPDVHRDPCPHNGMPLRNRAGPPGG